MSRSKPYQPLLFRLLHGGSALLALSALLTGFWVYNTYDGRWGKIWLPTIPDIQGIHGTFGLFFLLLIPAFAVYSFHPGQKRLIRSDSFARLAQVGRPIWWVSLQRICNTAMLLAATLSVISGRMMKEEWLPAGEIDRFWYYLHLSGWLVMLVCLALHLLMNAKVGGVPLLLSIVDLRVRPEDSPKHWPSKIKNWFDRQ